MKFKAFLREFIIFGFKQAWACLFGGAMLFALLATKYLWQPEWELTRYDFLFIYALIIQVTFLLLKLETLEEAKVIFLFHIVGTVMEIFKTHVGSWIYPEENLLRIGGVPLFSGFMYSCVGSYITRVTKITNLRYLNYPKPIYTYILAILIYVDFFTHHYTYDIRAALFAFAIIIYFPTRVYFTVDKIARWMPLLLAATLTAFFIWIAENLGTFTATWRYPDQQVWKMVSIGKLGSWFLLIIISFVLVSIVHPPEKPDNNELKK